MTVKWHSTASLLYLYRGQIRPMTSMIPWVLSLCTDILRQLPLSNFLCTCCGQTLTVANFVKELFRFGINPRSPLPRQGLISKQRSKRNTMDNFAEPELIKPSLAQVLSSFAFFRKKKLAMNTPILSWWHPTTTTACTKKHIISALTPWAYNFYWSKHSPSRLSITQYQQWRSTLLH